MMSRPRVILADDHAIVVAALTQLLEPEFEVIGVVEDGRELVARASLLRPDVALIDVGMPVLNGIDAARELRRFAPETNVVFVTQHTEKEHVRSAFEAGGRGYVLKSAPSSELLMGLRAVLAGNYFLSTQLREKYPAAQEESGGPIRFQGKGLTERQREVLQLVAEGKTAKEVAHLLSISLKTAEFHKSVVMRELGLKTIPDLTRYALEHGMLKQQRDTSGSLLADRAREYS